MNRLKRLLAGTRSPVVRKRKVNAALRWLMWDPDRANTAIMLVLVVTLAAVGYFVFNGAMWVQNAQYESQVVAYKAAQSPTPTSGALVPLSAAAPTVAPEITPEPLASAAQDVEKAPQGTARAFLAAWEAGPGMSSQKAWLRRLQPHTAPNLMVLFKATDRATVPTGPVTDVVSITVPDLHTSHLTASVGTATVALILSDESGRWLVTDITPGD